MHNTQMIEEGTTTHTKRKNKRTRRLIILRWPSLSVWKCYLFA